MELIIRYIPDIFPISFADKRKFDAEPQKIKSNITNFKTAEKWAFSYDPYKIERIKQSVIEQRYQVDFPIRENTELPIISQTDYSYIITNTESIINIYDVIVNYEDKNGIYSAKLEFSVKDYNNISSPVEHKNIYNFVNLVSPALPINYIDCEISKPCLFSGSLTFTQVSTGGLLYESFIPAILLPDNFEEVLLTTYFLYYHCSDNGFNANPAVTINEISSLGITISLIATTSVDVEKVLKAIVLDYEPEIVSIAKIASGNMALRLYTPFIHKFEVVYDYEKPIKLNSGIDLYTSLNVRKYIKVPIFVDDVNLVKIDYFAQATSVNFYDSFSDTKFYGISNGAFFEKVENKDLTNLHEFMLKLEYSNFTNNLLK